MKLHERARLSAAALPEIVTQYAGRGERYPGEEFKALFERCFREARGSDRFRSSHIQAARAAIKTGSIGHVRYILDKDPTRSILSDDADNICIALCVQGPSHLKRTDPVEMVDWLLQYGARINGIDDEGNTPIFNATLLGLPSTFKYLLDNDAGFATKHKLPARGKRKFGSKLSNYCAEHEDLPQPSVDLMEIALNAMDHSDMQLERAYESWAPIILFFIDSRFDATFSENLFTDLINVASGIGDIEAVGKYLRHQAQVNGRSRNHGFALSAVPLAPGLKSTTKSGHVGIVELLLLFGADPRVVCPDRRRNGRKGLREHTCPVGDGNYTYTEWKTAIAAVCDEDSKFEPQPKSPKTLDACEMLFWKGVSGPDQRRVLAEAALQGRIDIVERLCQSGVFVEHAPLTTSMTLLEFFQSQGFRFDWIALQKHAIRSCKVDALDWLVRHAGPCLQTDIDLGDLLTEMFYYNGVAPSTDIIQLQKPMVLYLCTSYAPLDRAITELHAQVGRLMLSAAIHRPSHLETILLAGIESSCPAMKNVALSEMWKHSQPDERLNLFAAVENRIKALQLLYRCHEGTLCAKTQTPVADEDQLWLTPTMLEAKVDGHVSEIVGLCIDPAVHSNPPVFTLPPAFIPPPDAQTAAIEFITADMHGLSLPPKDNATGVESKARFDSIYSSDFMVQRSIGPATHINDVNLVHHKLNSAFMTRLLVIEPAAELHAPIKCTLTPVCLAGKPEYEALSYVWGDGTNEAAIEVNGCRWFVRQSLRAALRGLRFRELSRVLWIDALCINQHDIDERNQQVRIMSSIYRSAKQVLIWIGESDDKIQLAFDYLDSIRTKSEEDDNCDEPNDGGNEHVACKPRGTRWQPRVMGELLQSFQELCARPWFSRTWTIQEFALAKEAVLVCGKDEQTWDLAREQYPNSPLEKLSKLRTSPSVESVLEHSIKCAVTDPRDKVYALLGFLDYPSVKVDYRLTVEEVYASFSGAVFEQDRSIMLLHKFGFEKELDSLPSWAMDLSAPRRFGRLPPRSLIRRPDNASEPATRVLDGFKIQDSAMFIKGSRLDQIYEVGPTLPPPNLPDGPSPTHAEVRNVIHDWESCASRMPKRKFSVPIPAAFMTTLQAHDNTRNRWMEPLKYGHYRSDWHDSLGTGPLKEAFPSYFRNAELIWLWMERFLAMPGATKLKRAGKAIPQEMECCYGRSFFTTTDGTMGLCHPRARPGDLVVFLSGASYPFTLRGRADGSFEMIGDCYLYDFDEHGWSEAQMRDFEEFKIT